MKKIVLALLIIASAYQLKAQQLILKPIDSILLKAPGNFKNHFKLGDSTLFRNFLSAPKQAPTAFLTNLKANNNSEVFYSTTPVVKLESNDNMAIIRPGNSNEHYMMLIKRIKVVDPLKQQLVTP